MMMSMRRECAHRFATMLAATILLGGLVPAAGVAGQSQAGPGRDSEAQIVLATVIEDEIPVRSGPYEKYYPFGLLKRGDVVPVVGEENGWVRLRTRGPAFESFHGFIRYARTRTDKLRVAADGKTAVTLGRTDILAPNINSPNPARDSWRTILRLPAEQTVRILQTAQTERDIVHQVALPETAEGWVSVTQLRAATDEEIDAWSKGKRAEPPRRSAQAPSAGDAVQASPERRAPAIDSARAEAGMDRAPRRPREAAVSAPAARPPSTPRSEQGTSAREPREVLADLESALRQLSNEPIETAEVMPLRELYLARAEQLSGTPEVARYARARAEQLQLWADLQDHRRELARARARVRMTTEEARSTRLALEAAGHYAAVGRLAASTIYDGKRLPKLLRLQDPATSRTIAYLEPSEEFDLVGMVGQFIGIAGEKSYDGAMRLHIIRPQRIDILAPQP